MRLFGDLSERSGQYAALTFRRHSPRIVCCELPSRLGHRCRQPSGFRLSRERGTSASPHTAGISLRHFALMLALT